MNSGKRLIAAAAVAATLASVCCGEVRTWTDATGKYSVQAELVEVQGENAILKKPDGRSITVPLTKLSAADRAYARQQTPMAGRASASTGQPLWTLDVAKMKIPDQPAHGLIHGHPFAPDRAQFRRENDWFELRQGKDNVPDLSLAVVVFSDEGQTLEGRTFRITPKSSDDLPPHVILHWRDQGESSPDSKTFMGVMDDGKYAMILEYGKKADGKLPGRIYVCLSDKEHSVVAGTFAVPAAAEQKSSETEAIKDAVTVEITGVNSDADTDHLIEILPEMIDPSWDSDFSMTQAQGSQVWKCILAPVKDVQAFARKIKFGKVTGVQDRTIKVQYGK